MIGKLRRLFLLYRRRHRVVPLPPRELTAARGRIGWLDRAWLQDGTLTVEGWSCADRVALRLGGQIVPLTQRPERTDVPAAYCARGFRGSGTAAGPLGLRLDFPDGYTDIPLGRPILRHRLAAEADVMRQFLRDGWRALPHARKWLRSHAPADRARARAALRLDECSLTRLVDPALLGPAPAAGPCAGVTVVVPVHGARVLATEALLRLSGNTDVPWHAIVIDDDSPDPLVWPMLRDWSAAQGGRVTLLRNVTNLGFPATVNRALALAPRDRAVVLLNTDAMLPPDWATRLLAPLADPRVASVTPLSNDAEICTVPLPGHPQALTPGEAQGIDLIAATLGGPPAEVPTGVGFCMALSPRWLDSVGGFDPVFGRGYGEEVDWCQRARARGARHVVQHRLFVEHRSGASFGKDARAARITRAGRLVAARYPSFDADVQAFLASDPLATARMALALARLGAAGHEVPVILAHSLGGGADLVLRRRLATGMPVVVLRVGGPVRWRIELHETGRELAISTPRLDEVRRLLHPLRARIIYSCGVGDPDPVTLPGHLLALAGDAPVEVEVHDYFMISPSVFLLDGEQRYGGVPPADSRDPADRARRPDGREVGLDAWREVWGRLVCRAGTVRVFSQDSARLVTDAYPSAAPRIQVAPHAPLCTPTLLRPPADGRRMVGVLGNIGLPKGAGLLCDLARMAARGTRIEFTLFGALDPAFSPPPRLRVLGGYAHDDIAPLAQGHGVGAWLIPSICPETFSFATHEALATGLPVVGLALGAQGEAIAAQRRGVAVPLKDGRASAPQILDALNAAFDDGIGRVCRAA